MIDSSFMRAFGLSHPPYNPIDFETEYHRVNRAFNRRRSFTRIAWIVGLMVGVGIVVLIQQG